MTRIRMTSTPWPQREGCEGVIVNPTSEQAKSYPFKGIGKNEAVVLLDEDPLTCHEDHEHQFCRRPYRDGDVWTCVVPMTMLEILP